MQLQLTVELVYAAVVTVGLIAVGMSNFLGGARKAQADAITAMASQINAQKETMNQQATEIALLKAKVDSLEKYNEQLSELVRGIPDWTKIHAGIALLEVNSQKLDEIINKYPVEESYAARIRHDKVTEAIAAKLGASI